MKIFKTIADLQHFLQLPANNSLTVGLVPTMGALHAGHLSLLKTALQQSQISVCSIFVNPTQFNDPKDLEKYPRPVEQDIAMLENAGCDVLFMPDVPEMYPQKEFWHLDIGPVEYVLEGKYRPGHYQGVMQVVYKLFMAVKPDLAFFGQKDFQQFKVIEKMIALKNLPVKLVMCPIIREAGGLAMSSRNIHLSAPERKHALILSQALNQLKNSFIKEASAELAREAAELISVEPQVQLEYLEVVNMEDLTADLTHQNAGIIVLVAAKVGNTRLIDNMILG